MDRARSTPTPPRTWLIGRTSWSRWGHASGPVTRFSTSRAATAASASSSSLGGSGTAESTRRPRWSRLRAIVSPAAPSSTVGDLNEYEPPAPVAATTIFRAIYYAHDRRELFRRIASYTESKLVFDLNPRQYELEDVLADLRAAGLPRVALRPFFVPQTVVACRGRSSRRHARSSAPARSRGSRSVFASPISSRRRASGRATGTRPSSPALPGCAGRCSADRPRAVRTSVRPRTPSARGRWAERG